MSSVKKEIYDVLIVGCGAAGCYGALQYTPDINILMLSKYSLTTSNSNLAQGGVAAVLSFEDDSYELHINDTMQETMSLSARFGLTITFQKPDKDEYLNIVRSLAKEYGLKMDDDELCRRAEAHAIRKNGRSPRTAKQFVELLKIGIGK